MAPLLTLGSAPDRVLHPLRRRVARSRLVRRRPLRSVLLVCHGNICRSPFAAAVLRRVVPSPLRERMDIQSAGFVAAGRPPAEALQAAASRGVDLSWHVSRVVTAELVHAAELIVVMDDEQRREIGLRFGVQTADVLLLGDLDPLAIETRMIRDPVGQARDAFEECYARIERCTTALADALVRGARKRAASVPPTRR